MDAAAVIKLWEESKSFAPESIDHHFKMVAIARVFYDVREKHGVSAMVKEYRDVCEVVKEQIPIPKFLATALRRRKPKATS